MSHDEARDILTALIASPEAADVVSPEQVAAAQEHVACCQECSEELTDIGVALGAAPPETATKLRALFGCEAIVPELYKVSGLDAEEMQSRFPRIAGHLARCIGCRGMVEDLDEICAVDSESQPIVWRDLASAGGDRIRELAGTIAFRVRRGLIAAAAWPEGLAVVPIGAGAGAMRGSDRSPPGPDEEPPAPTEAPGQAFHLDLEGVELDVDVSIEGHGSDRIRLEVQVARAERPVSVALRRVEGEREQLVAAQDAVPSRTFVAGNLQPGEYYLEVREHPTATRQRIRLTLDRG